MEHESFEDEKVAEIMNEYYINIKGIKIKIKRIVINPSRYIVVFS